MSCCPEKEIYGFTSASAGIFDP